MSKKRRKKTRKSSQQRSTNPKKNARYSPAEIAMAVLGAAIVIMIAGIVISALLG